MLDFVRHPEMIPPVALLAYVPDEPRRASFYPYAEFSARMAGVALRARARHRDSFYRPAAAALVGLGGNRCRCRKARSPSLLKNHPLKYRWTWQMRPIPSYDPLDALAEVAGFSDGERWWEYLVEERPLDAGGESHEIFTAVMEMMRALRFSSDGALPETTHWRHDPIGPVREASMRQAIRAAQREGFERIAVVCGCLACTGARPGEYGRRVVAISERRRCTAETACQGSGEGDLGGMGLPTFVSFRRLRRRGDVTLVGTSTCGDPRQEPHELTVRWLGARRPALARTGGSTLRPPRS